MNINWVAILSIGIPSLITLVIYFLQKNKKRLSFEILQNKLIMSNEQKAIDDIKIFYKNQEVKNISIVEIAFFNNGNKSIEKSDFEKDIQIYLQNNTVLSSEVIHTIPEALDINLRHDEKSVTIFPVLLNSNDLFIIRMILKDSILKDHKELKVIGRIKEVKDILSYSENKIPIRLLFGGGIIIIGAIIFGFIYDTHPKPQEIKRNVYDYLAMSIMMIGLLISLYGYFLHYKFKRINY